MLNQTLLRFVAMVSLITSGYISTACADDGTELNLNELLNTAGVYGDAGLTHFSERGYDLVTSMAEGSTACADGECECVFNMTTWGPVMERILSEHGIRKQDFIICMPSETFSSDSCDKNNNCDGKCVKEVKNILCIMAGFVAKTISVGPISHEGICRRARSTAVDVQF